MLFDKGINRAAQKLGRAALELTIEAKDDDATLFRGEVADLLYHLLVHFELKNNSLTEIEQLLRDRHYKQRGINIAGLTKK